MTTQFNDTQSALSETLQEVIRKIQGEEVTLRGLLAVIGEQGLLMTCLVLTLPFLLPVSVPGISTLFGLVIILLGLAVTFNRMPWIPARLLDKPINSTHLVPVLQRSLRICELIERRLRRRLPRLTDGTLANRLNGLGVTLGGVLLLFPLSIIPFSNTLPAIAVLALAIGMLQRDGVFVLGGYVALLATIVYFGSLALLVILGGQSLYHLTF